MRNFKLLFGGIFFVLLLGFALIGPTIAKSRSKLPDPMQISAFLPWQTVSPETPLGTDGLGRDAMAVFLNGMRLSLGVGFVAGLIGTLIGVMIGFIAGYIGGGTDTILRIITDMFLVVPTLPLLMVLSISVDKWDLFTIGLLLGIFSWPFVARSVRAQVFSLSQRPFVDLARINNQNSLEIIVQELIPGLLPYIFLSVSSAAVGAMLAEAGLQILGIGSGQLPTLGYLMARAMGAGALSGGFAAQVLLPAAYLTMTFLCLNMINMGLDEVFNPRLQSTAQEH
jgi:peptide/nickel transport system permease protein